MTTMLHVGSPALFVCSGSYLGCVYVGGMKEDSMCDMEMPLDRGQTQDFGKGGGGEVRVKATPPPSQPHQGLPLLV